MSGRTIEIQMAAVGADAAAAEISKTTAAVDDLGSAQEKVGENLAEAGQQARSADPELGRLVNIERARAVHELSKGFIFIGENVSGMADKFREADPEMAATLDTLSTGFETLGGMASYAAQGFAVAGPAGAAAGAAIGLAVPLVTAAVDAYAELVQTLADVEASFDTLADLEEGAAARHEAIAARRKNAELRETMLGEADAARALTQDLKDLAEIQAAAAKLDAAKNSRSDAARIRAGEDELSVKAERIFDDAEAKKQQLDEGLRVQQASAAAARRAAEALATSAASSAATPGIAQERIDADARAAAKAEAEAAAAAAGLEKARRINEIKKEEVDATAGAKIEAIAEQRQEREARAAAAEKKAQERAAAEAAQDRYSSAEDGLDASAQKASGAFGAHTGAGTSAAQKAAASISKKLADGTDGNEIRALQAMFESAVGNSTASTVSSLREMLAAMSSQAAEIAQMKEQIRNARRQ